MTERTPRQAQVDVLRGAAAGMEAALPDMAEELKPGVRFAIRALRQSADKIERVEP